MGKVKNLLKNISIFGISQFASKALVFFLLPLYTKVLATDEFGNVDLMFTTVSLLIPFVTLEIYSAVMRYSIETVENSEKYFLKGFFVTLAGIMIALLFLPLLIVNHIFDGYIYLFYILLLSNSLFNLATYYCRGIGSIKTVGVVSVISTAIIVSLNLLFLLYLRMGIKGYLLAYSIGYLVPFIIVLFLFIPRLFKKKEKTNPSVSLKEMLRYSIPLVPNNVAWWGVSSANKYLVTIFFGAELLGLYSVSLKIPTIVVTIQAIVAEGLALSIFQEYKENDSNNLYYSNLYRFYNCLMMFLSFTIICAHYLISNLLFSNDFIKADLFVPLLCISPIFGGLSGYLGTFYSANKKNNGLLISTIVGALVSLAFSFALIRFLSIWAIIIGNIFGYFVIWLYRAIGVKKFAVLRINYLQDIVSWALLAFLALLNTMDAPIHVLIIVDIIVLSTIFAFNYKFLKNILLKMFKMRKKEFLEC